MLEITKNTVDLRAKDEVMNKNTRMEVSKKRQSDNLDPDGSSISISKINSIPFEDLQNRMTSIQVARNGLENSISILDKMKELVYSDSKDGIESFNKKKFDLLKEELNNQKKEIEESVRDLSDSSESKMLNSRINKSDSKNEAKKAGHLEFIKSLKSIPDLNSIHKGLTAEKVASLLS